MSRASTNRLIRENARLRTTLKQIAQDCFKVANDEVCSEAERRTWISVGRLAANASRDEQKEDGR